MPVTKTTRECYEVREGSPGKSGSEWANITLSCWERLNIPYKDGVFFGGEIQISSSFGSWANSWGHCGCPFKKFLISLEFDYIFTKFMGSALDKFDGEACEREIHEKILEARKNRHLNHYEARAVWNDVDMYLDTQNEHDYGHSMFAIGRELGAHHELYSFFNDPCEWPRHTRYDYQAEGFWKQLWPLFVDALKAEIQQPEGVPT